MMRLLLALLLPLGMNAQAPSDDFAAISGTVVNAITGEPVRRATVMLRRVDIATGTAAATATDANGNFVLSAPEPGTYRLTAEHAGFLPAQFGARGPARAGTSVVLERGQKVTGLRVNLYPHAVISGRVVDEDGEPVPNIDVQVSRLQYMQGRKQLARSSSRMTDDLGEYRIFGLAPGQYYVSALYRPNANAPASPEGQYVTTYYPRTADPGAAAPVEVTAGSQVGHIDLTLVRMHTVSVKGRVTSQISADSAGSHNLQVILSARNPVGAGGENGRGAQTLPDGSFEFAHVVPGSYHLVAVASAGAEAYSARIALQVGSANIEGLAIVIPTPITVTGQVKIEGGDTGSLGLLRVATQPFDGMNTVFGPMPESLVKPDGAFQFTGLSAERYRIVISGLPEGYYVKSMRAGDVDVQMSGLDLSAGAPAAVAIVVSPNAGQLTGSVVNSDTAKPAAAVSVVLIPQERDRRDHEMFYRTTVSDSGGNFVFRNVVPGEYKVFSWDEVPYGIWMDSEFVGKQTALGESVTISEGGRKSLHINLIQPQ